MFALQQIHVVPEAAQVLAPWQRNLSLSFVLPWLRMQLLAEAAVAPAVAAHGAVAPAMVVVAPDVVELRAGQQYHQLPETYSCRSHTCKNGQQILGGHSAGFVKSPSDNTASTGARIISHTCPLSDNPCSVRFHTF